MTDAPAARTARTTSESTLAVIAAMLVLAGVIHVVVIPEHVDEWVPFAVAFGVAAAGELALAVVVVRAPTVGRLRFAAAFSVAIAAVWLISRTTGLPVGPDAGEPEAVGPLDVAATAAELHVACAGWWLTRPGREAVDLPSSAVWAALVILIGGIAALAGGGGH